MYSVGNNVVHPCHGAGTIVRISQKSIGDTAHMYYVIDTISGSMRVMVPVHRAESMGLRGIGETQGLRSALLTCMQAPQEDEIDWDHTSRQRDLAEKLKSGSFDEVLTVVRVLHFISTQRPLGMTDRQMLDQGKSMLAGELALATGVDLTAATQEVENSLASMQASEQSAE